MFLVQEIQTNWNDTVAVLPIFSTEDEDEAMSRFYSIVAATHLSNLKKHTALVYTDEGFVIDRKCHQRLNPKVSVEETM